MGSPQPPRKTTRMAGMEIGSKSILNITNLAVIGVLIGLILFIIKIASVFGIFIFSFVIAFLLYPLVDWVNERRIPRVWSILIVYIIIGVILVGISAAIVPAVIAQADSFLSKVPDFIERFNAETVPLISQKLEQLQGVGITPGDINDYLNSLIPAVQKWALDAGKHLAAGLQGAVGGIVTMFTVPIIVFYLLLDAPKIYSSLMKFAPPRTGSEVDTLLENLSKMLGHYLRGQLKLSFLMFAITTIALWILGVRHALLLGVLAGITEIIPIIGPIIALIPALLAGYFEPCDAGVGLIGHFGLPGIGRALIILAFYLVLQWFEGNIMVPRIMGKDLNLHPLTVMFALLAGGYLAGVFGMLLGLPIAAVLKVIFETYYPPFIQRVEDLIRQRPLAQHISEQDE